MRPCAPSTRELIALRPTLPAAVEPRSTNDRRVLRVPERGSVELVADFERGLAELSGMRMTRLFAATYRLQLLPHLDFEEARDARALSRELGVSHLYLSPSLQAASGSTHGYDVVDPTRLSDELGGRGGVPAALRLGPRGHSRRRPEPHGRERREPVLARAAHAREVLRPRLAKRAASAGSSTSTSWPACESRMPRSSRRPTRRSSSSSPKGCSTESASITSDGLAEPGALPRAPPRGRASSSLGREDPRAGRAAAGLAGRGHDRVRVRERRHAPVRRPGSRGAADAALRRAHRRDAPVRGDRRRGEARAGASTFEPEVDWLGEYLARSTTTSTSPRSLASFQVYRTYVEPDTGRGRRPRPAGGREARLPARLADLLLLEERGHDAFVTRFQQTTPPVMAKGVEDTAFYRYNRLLCLNEVGGDPAASRSRSTSSTPRTSSAPAASRTSCSPRRRTTRSAAAMCARGSAPSPGTPRSGSARAGVARAQRPPSDERRARRERGVLHLPDALVVLADRARIDSTATSRRRCARPRSTRAGLEPDDGVGAAACRVRRRSARAPTASWTTFEPFVERIARDGRADRARRRRCSS